MIYHCPDCGVFWYIYSQYGSLISWNILPRLLITPIDQTIKRSCPNHTKGTIESAGVSA